MPKFIPNAYYQDGDRRGQRADITLMVDKRMLPRFEYLNNRGYFSVIFSDNGRNQLTYVEGSPEWNKNKAGVSVLPFLGIEMGTHRKEGKSQLDFQLSAFKNITKRIIPVKQLLCELVEETKPVVISEPMIQKQSYFTSDVITVNINGLDVSGSPETIRMLLGVTV